MLSNGTRKRTRPSKKPKRFITSHQQRQEREEEDSNFVGSKVRKLFDGHGWFDGEVVSYDEESGFYKVLYEDGDEEEYYRHQLRPILRPSEGEGDDPDATMMMEEEEEELEDEVEEEEEEASDADDEEEYTLEEEDSDDDDDDGDDDDDDDDYSDDEPRITVACTATPKSESSTSSKKKEKEKERDDNTAPAVQRQVAVVAVTPSPNKDKKSKPKSSLRGGGKLKNKKAKPKPTTTATTNSSSSFSSSSSEGLKSSGINKNNSIAARGLPRGALAKCNKTGITIRSLDGIPPLRRLRRSSTTGRPSSTTTTSSFLDSKQLLPGRILVVAVDHEKGYYLPTDFVGKTFASATALLLQARGAAAAAAAALSQNNTPSPPSLDYSMEVVADPVFAPWDFVQARLASSGLLDTNDDDVDNDDDNINGPLLFVVQIQWDGKSKVSGSVTWYKKFIASASASASASTDSNNNNNNIQWAIIESDQKDLPSVLVGAPLSLIEHTTTSDNYYNSHKEDNDYKDYIKMDEVKESSDDYGTSGGGGGGDSDEDLLPPPSAKVAQIHLPASLLQKSIRRGNGLCSPAPLLEACAKLLLPQHHSSSSKSAPSPPPPGSTLAMLKTVWGCMLVDASPFDDADGCLGLPSLLLLSLVAKAHPYWTMPAPLRRAAVAGALRTARSAPSQPWVGFARRSDDWWELEENELTAAAAAAAATTPAKIVDQKASDHRNIIRAAQAVIGGRLAWGKWDKFIGDTTAAAALSYLNYDEWDGSYLPAAPPHSVNEMATLVDWEDGKCIPNEPRFHRLDKECRLSAIEPTVMPYTLVLLQAVLSRPPASWKKHGLPSLSRQIRKLISEANARVQERAQLARLATWGKEKTGSTTATTGGPANQGKSQVKTIPSASYKSFREVVTPTGTLSEKETEVVDCFEAIQEWVRKRLQQEAKIDDQDAIGCNMSLPTIKLASSGKNCSRYSRVKAGEPLTAFDGRVAFLLAFATSIEVEVCPDPQSPSSKEIVSAMFCGDIKEPLLVQRIGRARREGKELATAGGTMSGATAVPSLGYVQRNRSIEEAKLFEAAEEAVAKHWKGGKTLPLPLPPPGIQWELPGNPESKDIGWEETETAVKRTAELVEDSSGKKMWRFTIAEKDVDAFDAREVISPCALDLDDESHRPVELEPGSEGDRFLRLALYIEDNSKHNGLPFGEEVLKAMAGLHALAKSDRDSRKGLSEGRVYDWMPLACASLLPSRTWRDALLAIRTREKDHVILGRGIRSDGTGAPRDMVEGTLVRIFHALEFLYPTALRKEGALKFRVRPRGAAYYHLLAILERLGRGEGLIGSPSKSAEKQKIVVVAGKRKRVPLASDGLCKEDVLSLSKHPRRSAAVAASKKAAVLLKEEMGPSKAKLGSADTSDVCMYEDLEEQGNDKEGSLPLPKVKTTLWSHQEASVAKVVEGVREGKRGHADASAVGAGKTLTALATIVRLARWIEESGRKRHGVLVMLPTKALIREWLLEIATHTEGFHVIEQREDGTLFSLTYGKTHPPIDCNSLIISTLDRVCNHPFVRQAAWDFVVIDECLSVQNAAAKRNPSAWRQIEVSMCGVLMLSATFFRSQYLQLFFMIRMLRSPLPRTMEWLPATIHEHIVCQIPETDRTWQMKGEMVPLVPQDLHRYRDIIEAFRRKQINEPSEVDGRKLWVDLECFLRLKYEGRDTRATYRQTSVMGDAFARVAKGLLRKGRRPLVFADTSQEADFLLRTLSDQGLDACAWAEVASRQISVSESKSCSSKTVIVAVKTVEGQGINMQRHADAILCRPTPGDHLEQMKGRIDRPGQIRKELLLVCLVAEHTIEEAKFANIRLAGNFFREYIAPVATKYKERIDLEATLTAGGTSKLKSGTVSGAWKRSLEAAGQSGAFADFDDTTSTCTTTSASTSRDSETDTTEEDSISVKSPKAKHIKDKSEPKYKPLNKVIRNKGDPKAVRQAKSLAKSGHASHAVRLWLFPPKVTAIRSIQQKGPKPLAKESLLRFSDATPPVVLDRKTVYKAVAHLSKNDPKLAALIARVGADALVNDCGKPKLPTQARLFDRCLRAITFTMVSVDAGNAFLRRLAMKVGTCLERKALSIRNKLLNDLIQSMESAGDMNDLNGPEDLLQLLLEGKHNLLTFTHPMLRELVNDCEVIKGKQTGYPHLCGVTFPCGKNDDHSAFLAKARAHAKGGNDPVSAGFSNAKAGFIISLVEDFECGKISGEKIAKASDRQAAKMLIELKGIGDWCAGGVLMHFLSRADIMLYGDLTVRNYLNDLYDINHQDESETLLESAADFADSGPNRNLIDDVAKEKGWSPYRSVVCYLMYHLQEENLVLL